jgi:multiple sugar transport system substrate-binding protein
MQLSTKSALPRRYWNGHPCGNKRSKNLILKEEIMKKILTAGILAACLFPLFAAGTKEKEPAAASSEPVTVEFWSQETQTDRVATVNLLINTYEALHPNVHIKCVLVDENDMATQLQTAAAANTLPVLIETGAENAVAFGVAGLMNTGATENLLQEIGKEKFYTGALKLVESENGTHYAVPYHGWIQGIWYRADWFKEAHLAPPTTWESILAAAKYFYHPEKNQYGILVGTKAESYTEQCFTPIALSNGAALFNADGQLVFNSPKMKEAVKYYSQLAQYNPPGPQSWRARDYYLQGKMAMFFYSTYIMDDLALQKQAAGSLTGDNFSDLAGADFDPELADHTGMVPVIQHTKSASYGTIYTFGIVNNGNSAATAAALDFLKYMYEPQTYITFLHMSPGGMNPVIKGIADNPDYLNDPEGLFTHYGKEKMAEITAGMNTIQSFSIVDGKKINAATVITSQQIIPNMLYRITQEGQDVDTAMKQAETEMQKIIQK